MCCLSFLFPCVQYGNNAQKIDGSSFCGACCLYCCCMSQGCQCLIAGAKRTTLRHNYMLEESCCADCCVHWCCPCCALSQEARELEIRGPPPPRQSMSQPHNIVIMNSPGGQMGMAMPSPNGVMMTSMGYPGQPVPQGGGYMVGPNGAMMPAGHGQMGYAPQNYPQQGYPPPQGHAMALSVNNGHPTTPPASAQMVTSTDQSPTPYNYNQQAGQGESYTGSYTSAEGTTTTA